jgi:hypothetical protein
MIKFVSFFSLAGLIIPILFSLIWSLLIQYPSLYVSAGEFLLIIQLLVWPSSFMMMATAGHKGTDYVMLTLSIVPNIIIYTLLGFLIWWGKIWWGKHGPP